MTTQDQRNQSSKDAQPEDADKGALDAKPNWDRMGQIAKRMMATPPDRQVTAKAAPSKLPIAGGDGHKGR